jgi:hypothetical protein
VVRGFPNTYLTFYKGSTEDYFRVADQPEGDRASQRGYREQLPTLVLTSPDPALYSDYSTLLVDIGVPAEKEVIQ